MIGTVSSTGRRTENLVVLAKNKQTKIFQNIIFHAVGSIVLNMYRVLCQLTFFSFLAEFAQLFKGGQSMKRRVDISILFSKELTTELVIKIILEPS